MPEFGPTSRPKSELTASRLIDKIKGACVPICEFPKVGSAREQLAAGLRVTFQGNYAIYYLHDECELVIVRVLHGARDDAPLAERGGFS